MKPPTRRRVAPHRYGDQKAARRANQRLVWMVREKKELLWELKGQISEKTPNVAVQGRSEEEVASYCSWLRGRAAREAMQTEYGKLVRQKKIQEIQDPAPIELWMDLANRVCSSTEEAMNAAFSHMLTIASAEPLTLHHSIPCKEPPDICAQMPSPHGKNLQNKQSAEEELSSSGEEPTTSNPSDGRNNVDFENIYKYLSKVVRGEEPPTLSDFDSAVILHLLRCIPDQLHHLDAPQIGLYLYDTYTFLTTQLKSEDAGEEEETQSQPKEANWKELGFCPLNPFMMPLELLRQKEEEVTPP